jgi:dTDP-glucose 4,6-dehydratase
LALILPSIREDDPDVIDLDQLTYAGNLRALAVDSGRPRHRFEQSDVCTARALTRRFARSGATAAFHPVAETHVDRSPAGPLESIRSTFTGTFALSHAAHA